MKRLSKAKYLIIVNNIAPYGPELVNVLAAPIGAERRFRFQKKYAPTIGQVSALEGKGGLIVLRDFETGTFMPVRAFSSTRVRPVGGIIYLSVDLAYIAPLPERGREQRLQQFDGLIAGAIGTYDNLPGSDLTNLILIDTTATAAVDEWDEGADKDEVVRWGHVTAVMASQFSISEDYYKVVSVTRSGGKDVSFQGALPVRFFRRSRLALGYILRPGQSYRADVIQRTYVETSGDSSVPGSRLLHATVLDDSLSFLEDAKAIMGKYDVIPFFLRTNRGTYTTRTPVFFRISVDGKDAHPSSLELPMTVQPSALGIVTRITRAVIFIAALVLYAVPKLIFAVLPEGTTDPSSDVVEKVAVVTMILAASGVLGKAVTDRFELGA